jgi:hypothetical protein
VAYQDRLFITGRTSSGKSQLARSIFLAAPGRKTVIDPQGSDTTKVPGSTTYRDPRRPPDVEIRRFVPVDPADLDAYDEVYRQILLRDFPAYVWCDEAGDVFPVRRTPSKVRRLLTHGRKRQIGHIATHTRPREVDPNLIAQAAHVVMFDLPNPHDRRHLADVAGIAPRDLDAQLSALPRYGYLWLNVAEHDLGARPPLKL